MKRPASDRTLTPEQFTKAVAALGWKQIDFARRVGITPQSVNRWASGQAPCPVWATEYLGAMAAIKALHTQFLAPLTLGSVDAMQAPEPLHVEPSPLL